MDRQRVARELVKLAKTLTAGEAQNIDPKVFKSIGSAIEKLRNKYTPTDDHAIFLAIVRDMAFKIARGGSISSLAKELTQEFD